MVELVEATTSFSPIFYIIIISIIIIMALVIFFIKKLKYNSKQIEKSIGVSLLITLIIEILFLIIGLFFGLFAVYCSIASLLPINCPGPFEIFIGSSYYTAPAIFLIVMLVYYIIKIVKSK